MSSLLGGACILVACLFASPLLSNDKSHTVAAAGAIIPLETNWKATRIDDELRVSLGASGRELIITRITGISRSGTPDQNGHALEAALKMKFFHYRHMRTRRGAEILLLTRTHLNKTDVAFVVFLKPSVLLVRGRFNLSSAQGRAEFEDVATCVVRIESEK